MNITVTPSTAKGNTTFNITIKDTDGKNVTDGTVYFYNNNTLIGNTTVTNGVANYQYIFNKAGNYNIISVYNSAMYNSINKTVQFTITKTDTKLVVNPINGTVQNTITLQANITDKYNNKVTYGKVVFKINGTTIKDIHGNVIYAPVINGIATLQYIIPYNLAKDNLTIQAIYSGTYDTYNPSKNNNTINVTKRTVNINLIIPNNPAKATDTITFMTLIHDSNGTIINNGQVIFKFNGKTIKDNNGNTIKVNVTNGQALLKYTIPNGISAHKYNITAVYSNKDYNRTETNSTLTTQKINTTITLQPTNTTRYSNTTPLTGIIKDTNGNLMVGTHKIAVKLNGKSIGTYTTTNGIINTNITIPNTLKNTNYTITVKIGDTNGYYQTNSTTTLKINNIKTLKQKVSL